MGKYDLELKNHRKQHQLKNGRDSSKRYQEGNYECENILDMRIIKGHRYYLIKWKGYSSKDNTWEPVDNLLTIAADLLKFQHDKKQYVQKIQSKWNQLFHNRKVSEPLATNELQKIQRYSKKNEDSQDQRKKRRKERSKKIKKLVENSKNEKLEVQKILNYKRKLRVRYTRNPNIKNDNEQVVNQNQSQQISSIQVSNISSQILNSQFFQEKKCESVQQSSQKKNCGTQSPIYSAKKPHLFEELLEHTEKSKACEKSQKKPSFQKDMKQPLFKQILQNIVKQMFNSPQMSKQQTTIQILTKNQGIEQVQKSKDIPFRLSNYFMQTPKKSSIHSSNSPIQRSLNKYIYKSKLTKNTKSKNEKEKTAEIVSHLELPIKDIFYDIISEKASQLQDQEYLRNDYSQKQYNAKNYSFSQISGKSKQQDADQEKQSQINNQDESQKQEQSNIQKNKFMPENRSHQRQIQLDNHHQEKEQEEKRKIFFQAQMQANNQDRVNNLQEQHQKFQPRVEQHQKVNDMNIQSKQNRFILKKDASINNQKQQNRSPFQNLQKQIHQDFNSLIFSNKNNPFLSKNNLTNHKEQQMRKYNLEKEDSQSPRFSSEESSIIQKRHFNPRLIEQTINTSQVSPKIKKIVKPFKSISHHAFKKDKKNSECENRNQPLFLYDLSQLLMNSISFQELKLRCIKVAEIIKMYKFQGCSIFVVVVQYGDDFEERFILYNLMRDFYPRLLLKYLEQNGKLEV